MELNERKEKILDAVIRNYLETGEPVGSRTISKYTDLNLSSATIRNEMSDLEELGYIVQPHTSAGRIPTDKGYRFYVDNILKDRMAELDEREKKVTEKEDLLIQKVDKVETLLQNMAKMLATNTNYATMVSTPKAQTNRIKFVQLSVLEEKSLLCTVVSDNYNAGVQCAKDMMSKLKSANIVLLKHTTALSAKQRIEGFLDTIDAHSEYKIINQGECKGQLEKAMPVMQRILKETPEVDVVMALNDPSALGALAALESMGYEDVMVYGVDGTPDIKSLIEESPMVAGTVAQSPISIGKIAAKNMYDLLSGKEIGSNIVIPVEIITKENIAQFNKTGWQ